MAKFVGKDATNRFGFVPDRDEPKSMVYRLRVYVAGKYRDTNRWGVAENIRKAEKVGFQLAEMGCVPLIPHSLYGSFDGTLSDQFWLDATAEWLTVCDAVVLVPGWETSHGTKAEISLAEQLGIPVYSSVDAFVQSEIYKEVVNG